MRVLLGLLLVLLAAGRAIGEDLVLRSGVTDGELSRVKFSSVVDPPGREGTVVIPETETAVRFNREEFAAGEAVEGWLILHYFGVNNGRGLGTWFDLGEVGGTVNMMGSARVELVRVADGKEEVIGDVKAAAGSGGAGGRGGAETFRVQVSAGGYMVNSGDVRNLAAGGKLEAGEYVLRFWAEGQRSEGRFRVKDGARGGDAVAKTRAAGALPTGNAFLMEFNGTMWEPKGNGQVGPGAGGPAADFTVQPGYMMQRSTEDFAQGLSLGLGTGSKARHYMRLSDIPTEDESLKLSAEYVKGDEQKGQTEQLKLTLSAPVGAAGGGGGALKIRGYPNIYLLVENDGTMKKNGSGMFMGGWEMNGGVVPLPRPARVTVELSPEWTMFAPYTGKARVWVIMASDPVKAGADPQRRVMEEGEPAREQADEGERWRGILRSEPVEMELKSMR